MWIQKDGRLTNLDYVADIFKCASQEVSKDEKYLIAIIKSDTKLATQYLEFDNIADRDKAFDRISDNILSTNNKVDLIKL